LPASMWAMIPIFLTRSRGVRLGMTGPGFLPYQR
jgi:hypothetical protein